MENLPVVNPANFGIDQKQADELTKNLPQIISERDAFVGQFDEVIRMDIDDPATSKLAHDLRMRIRDNRTKGIEVWHKTTKDYFLKGGQFVDAIKRMQIAVNERMENDLEKIEKYRENIEKQRIASLQAERSAEVLKYQDITFPNLGEMPDEIWNNFISGIKMQYEQRIENERKAEEMRKKAEETQRLHEARSNSIRHLWNFLPEEIRPMNFGGYHESDWSAIVEAAEIKKKKYEAEQEKIRKENERLQKEAEANRKKAEAERIAREKKEAEERAANEAKLRAEREAREKVERELKEKQEAERKAAKEAEALRQAELKKGDAEKLTDLIHELESIRDRYSFKSEENQDKFISALNIILDAISVLK